MRAQVSWKRSRRPSGWIGGALALSLLVLVGTHGCGDEATTGPGTRDPGAIAIALISPYGPEGAAVLETSDPGIIGAISAGGRALLGASGGKTRIVILLKTPGRITASLALADVSRPPRLRVVEVADGEDRLRADLSGYTVQVVEPAIATAAEVGVRP